MAFYGFSAAILEREHDKEEHAKFLASTAHMDAEQLEQLSRRMFDLLTSTRDEALEIIEEAAKLTGDIDRDDDRKTVSDGLADLYADTAKIWPEYAARLRRAAE